MGASMRHAKNGPVLVVLALAAAWGCGHASPQHVTYAQATPIVEEPGPSPAPRTPTTVAYSAQVLTRRPLPLAAPAARARPSYEVIDTANKSAAQGPETGSYANAIKEYEYVPGMLYQIYAAPMRITDIALEPGEEVSGVPACGDAMGWKFQRGVSMVDGQQQVHIRVKPLFAATSTNFVVNTNRRTYLMELHSYETTYMAAVQWHYPQDELNALAAQAQQAAAMQRNTAKLPTMDKLRFGYKLLTNDDIVWRPTQVFDDGAKTYIVFPPAMLHREAPVLFVVRDHESQLVNFRVKRNWYIVDRLFERAELRVGQSDPEIVTIVAPGR